MERICTKCNQLKDTPYKNVCRKCYQIDYNLNLKEKTCPDCGGKFKSSSSRCFSCADKLRKIRYRKKPCRQCGRVGLLILNQTDQLCTKCDRQMKETKNPELAEIRKKHLRTSGRKKRGSDINAPIHIKKQLWTNAQGYVMTYKPYHPNSNSNSCVQMHTLVMSEHLGRPLIKGETVHHKNGIRDDNTIENLELWHKSQPAGQRIHEKIKWAKNFLESYGFKIDSENVINI